MDDLAEIVREAAYEKNRKKDSDKAKTSYGHQQAADNDIMFDDLDMREPYTNARDPVPSAVN